jgi:hypothetical protein
MANIYYGAIAGVHFQFPFIRFTTDYDDNLSHINVLFSSFHTDSESGNRIVYNSDTRKFIPLLSY